MPTKITVNGVSYDSVEAMPPDVRRTYEEMMEKFAKLGTGIPQVIHHEVVPLKLTTTVQKHLVVDGKSYGDEAAMPPDLREKFQQAMRAARTGDQIVGKNEVKVTFQVTGPGNTLGKTPDASSPARIRFARLGAAGSSARSPKPDAIEPAPIEGRIRFAIVFGVCLVALALWILARIH